MYLTVKRRIIGFSYERFSYYSYADIRVRDKYVIKRLPINGKPSTANITY